VRDALRVGTWATAAAIAVVVAVGPITTPAAALHTRRT
jgi:hypothetical protein